MALLRHLYPCSFLWSMNAGNNEKFLALDSWVVCQKSIVGLSLGWSLLLVHSLTVQSKFGQVHSLVAPAQHLPGMQIDSLHSCLERRFENG